VAQHAGYNVIEVNASDDRTGSVMERKIHSVLEISSVKNDGRPNLLVIDEVDGASAMGGDRVHSDLVLQDV
jgi:chromosome transmission fidelity protein 18